MTIIDKTKPYIQYAYDIIEHKIESCEAIYLACQRFLAFFERTDMYFDYDDVDKKIKFISLMKHTTGQHNGKRFILLGWQSWCVANIFGFKWVEDNLRVTKNVFMMLSRKNGKTAFAAAITLCCMIADNEADAECELVANSRQQAGIAFKMCKNFAESMDPRKKMIKRFRNSVEFTKTKSSLQVLSSDSMSNDGYNSQCFVLDEYHAQKNTDLYDVMKSSQGMRTQPLGIVITTAGFLTNGFPCFEYRALCIDILKGNKKDDTTFSAIYELDENDDYTDQKNWIKCCPSLGQTVTVKYMQEQVQAAINQPERLTAILTKNFNKFCQSKDVWIQDKYITDSFKKFSLDDFQDDECFMGVDLSAVSDMTATSLLFPPDKNRSKFQDKYVFINYVYLPESALQESANASLYKNWHNQKYLILTAGNVVDYDKILQDQLDIYKREYLLNVSYDQWNSTQWAINATAEGLPLVPYSQAIGNFNRPTKALEGLIRQNKVVILYNPIVRWCFDNVTIKTDWNANAKPVKQDGDRNRKIDVVISMIQALGGFLDYQKEHGYFDSIEMEEQLKSR